MEDIKITFTEKMLQDGLEKSLTESLKSSYNNPVNDLIVQSLKDSKGEIKKVIDDIIARAIGTDEFKDRMSNLVIQKLVDVAMERR